MFTVMMQLQRAAESPDGLRELWDWAFGTHTRWHNAVTIT